MNQLIDFSSFAFWHLKIQKRSRHSSLALIIQICPIFKNCLALFGLFSFRYCGRRCFCGVWAAGGGGAASKAARAPSAMGRSGIGGPRRRNTRSAI
jgi:hypothetical protein